MSKFKVGDRVEIVVDQYRSIRPRDICTVVRADSNCIHASNGDVSLFFEEDEVKPAKPKIITYDEFHSQLKQVLQEGLEAGIGIKSVELITSRQMDGKYHMLEMHVNAEVSGYNS